VADSARSIVVGTAGHIDHGKSSLVLALTGTDPDRLKEEKARGITIDLGFAHARVGEVNVAFVDVPGHERFVKNMLAGVGGIDAVLLVIAADESVMPQTREHFAICRLLQIPAGVVVLTKADLVDADTLELARAEARELIQGSLIADAPILAVSARTGQGLEPLREALARLAGATPARADSGAPRLPVDRVFSMRGFGTVVTGTLTAGTLAIDDELMLQPSGHRVKVRGLQVHGTAQPSAAAGHRVAVNLGGVELGDVNRGQTLAREGTFEETQRFDAVIDLLPDVKPLRHGTRVRFHHGTTELLGRIALAAERAERRPTGDNADSTDSAARGGFALQPGHRAYARIRLEAPAVLTRGDRFVLRQYSPSITIGGGRVLDPSPARSPIRSAAAVARFARIDATEDAAAMAFVEERRGQGLSIEALSRRGGMPTAAATEVAEALARDGRAVMVKGVLFAAPTVRALETALLAAVTEHHRAQPMSEGLAREEARERIFGQASPLLFDAMVATLVSTGKLAGRDRLALPGRGVSLTPEETRAQDALAGAFKAAGLAPPDLASVATAAKLPPAVADRVSKLLLRQKTLVKLDTLLFHNEPLERLKEEVKGLKGSSAKVDVASFKERYGISRKYAIPLLEWLDRERVTRRVGDTRVIL
jgi:selenocysteine-specific elongation factor